MPCFVGLVDYDISICYVHPHAKIIKYYVVESLLHDSAIFCFQL